MPYNYREAITADIIDYIREEVTLSDFESREALEEALYDHLWTIDGVIGNASGSYTFNSARARDYVMDNIDLLEDVITEFCIEAAEVGRHFIRGDFEYFDVSIRCYLLGECIAAALDEIDEELTAVFEAAAAAEREV